MHPAIRTILQSGDGKTYLYNLGDECTALTGGWSVESYRTTYTTVHTVAENASNIQITTQGNAAGAGQTAYTHATAIDLTNYTTLHCTGYVEKENQYIAVAATQKSGAWGTDSMTTWWAGYTQSTSTTETEFILDVSSFNGSYYIYMIAADATPASQFTATFTKVWLE
jgi:hypothetical protein